jgi:hypothetical protein
MLHASVRLETKLGPPKPKPRWVRDGSTAASSSSPAHTLAMKLEKTAASEEVARLFFVGNWKMTCFTGSSVYVLNIHIGMY